ncbi:ATP-grasp domain-containing protein [Chryseobacterium chendengshani]|uniref:ATP-grasp domain-containing protein n=1 Tax=Chryseobacterium sp. LJ668 TaxID=2864040 RepID=UPI001C692666|nr:ATP-grasp domain-containing protein [Chryseobacterium sp. LJ668]MBW8523333.1 ATP-grasp domain-containing protein [Chryseobacterium sp. LJ668]QYK15625.1 ATP-grasp domain-containing protein [Chryseobacterium sp. LJ668]
MKNIIALSPIYTEDSNNLKKASIISPYELNRFNAKWNVPEEFRDDVIAVYGEDIYAEIVAEQCNLTLTKPKDNWLAEILEQFTKRKISYGQLKDFVNEENIFIKCSDFKSFKAGVFDKVTDIKGFDSLDLESMVFISQVVEWELEVRCFVLNNEIKTYSSYWRNNAFDTNPLSETEQKELFGFFKDFIQKYSSTLPNAIVIDFGIIKGKGWALIEANPAWCSGLYACDAEKALEVIVESCIKN